MEQERTKKNFLAAYDAHGDSIFRFCLVKTSSREVAQDLAQETFMRYWQELRKGAKMRNEKAFLFTVARNLVIDWYRKKKSLSLDGLQEDGFQPTDNTHRHIAASAEVNGAMDAIEQLDEKYREVFMLRYVEGFPPRDIARIMGLSANVVSVRIHRARKQVQDILNNHG